MSWPYWLLLYALLTTGLATVLGRRIKRIRQSEELFGHAVDFTRNYASAKRVIAKAVWLFNENESDYDGVRGDEGMAGLQRQVADDTADAVLIALAKAGFAVQPYRHNVVPKVLCTCGHENGIGAETCEGCGEPLTTPARPLPLHKTARVK